MNSFKPAAVCADPCGISSLAACQSVTYGILGASESECLNFLIKSDGLNEDVICFLRDVSRLSSRKLPRAEHG
jgi:hypothetical protein